ncbi:TetR/AcrR family transcriptional regulator [Aeromicrobium sp. CF3.5]|uniref:TetR/AcrR family transcriptional regulator n=1 Tax=Aeromicrobium sp. CF3.5 TaxID=3373078 RepID=UPI003EE60E08
MESQPNTDGRIARGERTRAAIIAAHAALLRDGELQPTAAKVAQRAGVSVRTIWTNFKDREELMTHSTNFWLAEDDELWKPIDPATDFDARLATYVAQRVRRLENIAPAARSAALSEPFSPALRASRRSHVDRMRDQVELVFATELARCEESAHGWLLHAVVVAASWPTWTQLRDDYGLTIEDSAQVMERTMRVLLAT